MIPLPPFIAANLTRIAVYAGVALLLIAVGWMDGYRRGELKLFKYKEDAALAQVKFVKKIEIVKEEVRVPYMKKEIQIQTVFVTIEKDAENVPIRPACNVTAGWMRVHNNAASGDRRDQGAVDDPTDTGITEAKSAETVVTNYRSFHQIANDLVACRGFVAGLKNAAR